MRPEDGVVAIEEWLQSQQATSSLIAVAGGSCAGKTLFTHLVRYYLCKTSDVAVVYFDNYFKGIDDPTLPRGTRGYPLFDVPDSYHQQELVKHIGQLISGTNIWSPEYDISSNKRKSSYGRLVEASPIVVVDGLFAISLLKLHFKKVFGVFISANDSVRLIRRIDRDTRRFRIPEESIRRVYWDTIIPLHYEFVEPQKNEADLIINTDWED